jgi:hypothetical protein
MIFKLPDKWTVHERESWWSITSPNSYTRTWTANAETTQCAIGVEPSSIYQVLDRAVVGSEPWNSDHSRLPRVYHVGRSGTLDSERPRAELGSGPANSVGNADGNSESYLVNGSSPMETGKVQILN